VGLAKRRFYRVIWMYHSTGVGDPNHFVSFPQGSPLIYKIRAYHVDFITPANSTFTLEASVSAASFNCALSTTRNCVPQAGTSSRLDAIADRFDVPQRLSPVL